MKKDTCYSVSTKTHNLEVSYVFTLSKIRKSDY